jgi:hypothetical protein
MMSAAKDAQDGDRIKHMSDTIEAAERGGEDILTVDVSDEALEAAASTTNALAAALSFPSAPTVSILIMCCGNNEPPA